MSDEPRPQAPQRPTGLGRRLIVSSVAALTGVALLVLLHLPPVRAALLRRVVQQVQEDYGVRLDATRLDYNLATLRVRLERPRASRVDSSDAFFTADFVDVALPWAVLRGRVVVDEIVLTNPVVHIVRDAAGRTNLPGGSGSPSVGDRAALAIGRFSAPHLALDIRDVASGFSLTAPDMRIELTPTSGRIAQLRTAQLTIGPTTTRVERLDGGLAFDGRALAIRALQLQTDEGTATIAGRLDLLRQTPTANLTYDASVDLDRAARWIAIDGLPSGHVVVHGETSGPLTNPSTTLQLQSTRVDWRGVALEAVAARVLVTPTGLEVRDAGFDVAAGHVAAEATMAAGPSGATTLDASWSNIDLARLVDAVTQTPSPLAGRVNGMLSARGPSGDLQAWQADARLSIDSAAQRGLVTLPGETGLRLSNGRWSLAGSHVLAGSAPITLAVGGSLGRGAITTWPIAGSLTMARSDVPTLITAVRPLLSSLPTDVVTRGALGASGQIGGTVGRPDVRFRLDGDGLVVSGQSIARVLASGQLDGQTLRVDDVSAQQSDDNAAGMLHAALTLDLPSRRFDGRGDVSNWVLSATEGQPLAARIDATLMGGGRATTLAANGHVALRQAWVQGIDLGDLDADLQLTEKVAHVDSRAPDFGLRASADIGLAAPYDAMIAAETASLDLARALRDVTTPTPVTGVASLRANANVPLADWRRGRGTLEILSLTARAGDLDLRTTEPATAHLTADRVRIDRFEALAGTTHVSATGELGGNDAVLVTATGDVGEAIRGAIAAGVYSISTVDASGPFALLARATGPLTSPRVAADVEIGPATVTPGDGLLPLSGLRVRAQLQDDVVTVREASADYAGASLVAEGRVPLSLFSTTPPANGGATLRARATGLTPDALRPWVDAATLDSLTGVVDASADLTSTSTDLSTLTGEIRLDRFEATVSGLPVTQRGPTRIALANGLARIEAWDWSGEGANLAVRGQVRLRDRQVALLADGDLDLRMLTPFVRNAGLTVSGHLVPRVSVTGTRADPRVDGELSVTGGEVRSSSPAIVASDLTARAVLTRTTAHLTSLEGTANGGALSGTGHVEFTPVGAIDGGLDLEIAGMALDIPQGLRTESNASLSAAIRSGDDETSGTLSGTVTILRGAYRDPLPVVTGLLNALRSREARGTSESSPRLDALQLDVRVITDDDLVVDNNVGRLELGADLRLIGTAASPALSGRAQLREGGQLFLGRNVYTVNSGTIDFANPDTIEPDLDVTATTRAGGQAIQIQLTGTPDTISADLRSTTDPNLGQADIASLLLTGRPLDQLANDQAAAIGAEVLGNLSGDVLGLASRAVGLDVLRLGGVDTTRRDSSAVATEVDPTARLTFGKTLGRNLDVTFSQSLRDGDAQTWIVDYLPTRALALRFVSNDDDLRSYEFRHDVTFGGTRRAPVLGRETAAIEKPPTVTAVSTVSFEGDLAVPESALRGLLRLTPGKRFDFVTWQADRDRLERFFRTHRRLTTRIAVTRAEQPAGVALTYRVDAGPVTEVAIESPVPIAPAVVEEINRAWAESVFDGFLLDQSKSILRRELGSAGYVNAAIDARLVMKDTVRVLALTVTPGVRITTVTPRVNLTDEERRREIEALLARGPLRALITNPAGLESTIVADLRSRGFSRPRVTVGAPAFAGDTATVPVSIDPGQQLAIGAIAVEGVTALSPEAVRAAAMLTSGVLYEEQRISDARQRVQALYRREAFPSARVETTTRVGGDAARIDVTFVVNEGPRQVVGDVAVTGNRAIDEDVITRALRLESGEPLRPVDWLQARRRVFDTGLFRRVDANMVPAAGDAAATADADTRPMRVNVAVEEWPTLRVRYGLQVAEERPESRPNGRDLVPGFSADLERRTLFGRAVSLGAALDLQRRDRRGRVFMNAPTLFSLPIQSSLAVERAHEQIVAATLITDTSGVSLEQRGRLGKRLELSYGYRFERNHTFDTERSDDSGLGFDITINIARLTTTGAWDTRDDPGDATRGSLVSGTLEYSPESLGSDIRFVRHLTQAYHFQPWRRLVFATAGRVGVVQPLGGQDLLPSVKFYSGGARTVRGVAEDTLGARDVFGDPAGGEALFVLNQEVRFPIYRWLRGVGFIDAGNVFATPGDISLRSLTGSLGAGLRFATPVALLRIDYGRTVWPDAQPSSSRWVFGIGQAF